MYCYNYIRDNNKEGASDVVFCFLQKNKTIRKVKIMKKIISLIMCVFIVLCSLFFVSAEPYAINTEKLTVEEKKAEAIDENNNLLNYFIETSKSQNRSASFDYTDYFPDYYGGSYIDTNGELVVLIADKERQSKSNINVVEKLANEPIIKDCEYSYNELNAIMKLIPNVLSPIESSKAPYSGQVKCWAIDDEKNCIYVYLKDLNDDVITWFKNNVCDSDSIIFKKSNNIAQDEVNLSGQGISSSAGLFSGAFRVRRSTSSGYRYGFITCAHGNSLGTVIYGFDGTQIGTVAMRRFSGAYDVSYVEMADSSHFSNSIIDSPYTLYNTNENIDFPLKGSPVYLYARYNKDSFGLITSTNVGGFYNNDGVYFEGMPGASYSSTNGDSGGLVCTGPTNIYCDVVGVHKGTYGNYKVFTTAVNVVNLWYLNRY